MTNETSIYYSQHTEALLPKEIENDEKKSLDITKNINFFEDEINAIIIKHLSNDDNSKKELTKYLEENNPVADVLKTIIEDIKE